YVTQTTLSVPALMGAIMCVGVATSNSILMVTFANDRRREGADARGAPLEAGGSPRPAGRAARPGHSIGRLPHVPVPGGGGRAERGGGGGGVMGGLWVATFFPLFFVPVMYSLLRRKPLAPESPDGESEHPPAAGLGGTPVVAETIPVPQEGSS